MEHGAQDVDTTVARPAQLSVRIDFRPAAN
jgi:hypothetical protein